MQRDQKMTTPTPSRGSVSHRVHGTATSAAKALPAGLAVCRPPMSAAQPCSPRYQMLFAPRKAEAQSTLLPGPLRGFD